MTQNIFSSNGRGAIDHNASGTQTLSRRERATSPLFYECIWINGELVPTEDVALHDQAGVFEEIRCYPTARGPAIFRLEAHLQRFLQTARALGISDLRYNLLDLRRAAHVTVHVNSLSACTVQPILFVDQQPGARSGGDDYPTIAVVTTGRSAAGPGLPSARGLRLMVSGSEREEAIDGPARIGLQKRAARNAQARAEARHSGFDEAILADPDGNVIDCTADNLFLVRGGAVYTPSQTSTLPDVARHTALTLLHDLGYAVIEQTISRDQLYGADEVFLCGTGREIAPVRQIDSRVLNNGRPGPVTRTMQQLYAETTNGQGRRSRGWLEYVMMEPLF